MRLVFAGTPDVAVPSLEALLSSGHDVVAVVTRPDAASGRGQRNAPSPVATCAAEAGIEVLKPVKPSDPDFQGRLRELTPDCCPVVAYGSLVPPGALEIPGRGWVNLHFSLLPAWRGAAPVQHAILHGDEITGATVFRLEAGMDTGPVYSLLTETINRDDTAGRLLQRLSTAGANLLLATLDGIESGALVALPQPAEGISFAPKLTVEDAHLDWTRPRLQVDRLIRACTPSPGAWTMAGSDRMKLGPLQWPASPDEDLLQPGELRALKSAVLVGCGDGVLELGDVQPPGRRMMPASAWARGLRGVEFLRLA